MRKEAIQGEIPLNQCRIIKINREAVHELLNEFFMEHMEDLFQVSDSTQYTMETIWDPSDDAFSAVIFQQAEPSNGFTTDLEKVLRQVDFTAGSIFQPSVFQEFDLADFRKEEIE